MSDFNSGNSVFFGRKPTVYMKQRGKNNWSAKPEVRYIYLL